MRIPGADKAIDNLVKWSVKEEWLPLREQVFAKHFDMVCDRFDTTMEEVAGDLGDAFGMVFGCVLEDFFTAEFGEEGTNVIDDYLKRRGWREKVPAKRYLTALKDSVLSLYEVIDLEPGHRMTVKDMVRESDPITVEEKLGSETAAKWDRIAARIVTVNKKIYFTGSILHFPYEVADELLSGIGEMVKRLKKKVRQEVKKHGDYSNFDDSDIREMLLGTSAHLFTRIWLIDVLNCAFDPPPEIRNSDDDEIVFTEVRFPITGKQSEIAAHLNEVGEFEQDAPDELKWTWHGKGRPSKRIRKKDFTTLETDDNSGRTVLGGIQITDAAVILSTNSKERGDKGREIMLANLKGLLGQPLTSFQTLEKMLEEKNGAPALQEELPPEMAEQAIAAYLDDHYRQSLDEPLPFLNDKTPRQVAKTKKGRGQVVNWLKKLENSEARRASSQGQQPYDFQWMWRELKVDDLR